jgi:hypothetical protein
MSDLEPITRDEVAWSNGDLEPITRKEKYIKHLYDETQEIPDPPQTREEWFIKKAGEEIHDVTIEPLTATQNGVYSESGKAYSPVTVALPLGSKSVTANGTYNASDDSLEGYSSVSVDVPLPENGYLKKDLPTGAIATVTDAEAEIMPSLKIAITPVQEGSGDPSPTNIRPITGWSECNVSRTGKNLLNPDDPDCVIGYTILSNGTLTDADNISVSDFIKAREGISLVYKSASTNSPNGGYNRRIVCFDKNKNCIGSIAETTGNPIKDVVTSGVTPSGTAYVRVPFFTNYQATSGHQLEIGSTATAYEPYTEQDYSIPFADGTDPLTVYGGTLDVVNGGEQPNLFGFAEFDGSEDWINVGGSYPQAFQLDTGILDADQTSTIEQSKNNLSNLFPWSTHPVEQMGIRWQEVGTPNGRLYVYDETHASDLAGFKAMLNNTPLQIMYRLNTPTNFYTQPTSIKSLKGQNNIFADTGDILDGEYWSKNPLTVTRAMLNTLRDTGEITEITEPEEPEGNDER